MTQLQHFDQTSQYKLLGAGRSGKVFLVDDQQLVIARKIFYSDTIASIIHAFFFGSPNPYVWNQHAIQCAFYRRKVLSALVRYWFDDKLKVAEAISTCWNQEFKAYQMDTEFIKGRHVALQQPCSQKRIGELPALVHSIMIPLQKKLIESGFDGLVWQAGRGTPTALNNFLLSSDTSGKYTFVWIDLESGVPALFPLNPLKLFSFYIPKSLKYKRALFDDVDNYKLNKYINNHQINLTEKLGIKQYTQILDYIEKLDYHQQHWKSSNRVYNSIQYQLKKELITQEQARWYSAHPLLWYGRETARVSTKILQKLIQLPILIIHKLSEITYLEFIQNLWKFLTSQNYRLQIAKTYIASRIKYWQDRKHLKVEEAELLQQRLQKEESSEYINDFGVHLGLKLFVKTLEYLLVPILYVTGLIDEFIFITWLIIGGPIYRQTYTCWRIIQAFFKGKEIPWVAFLVGLIPTIGTLAYPIQIIYSSQGKNKKIAKFIVYDFFTRIGEKIPAWGGEDTQTEHFFNRLAGKLMRR